MGKKSTLILFTLTLLYLQGISQEKWTLQQCIDYGIQHNIQVQQQTLSTKISGNNYFQSKMSLYPNLNISGNHNYSEGRTVDPYTNSFSANVSHNDNFSLNSSITLFNGFKLLNTIKQQKFAWLASLSDIEKAKNDLALNIATAYLQVLFNEENEEINREQVRINEKQVIKTKTLLDAGSVTEGNLLDAQAQLANAQLQLVTAQNQTTMSILSLKQLMNLDSLPDFQVFRPTIDDISNAVLLLNIDTIFQQALDFLPQMKSAKFTFASNKASLAAARGSLSPNIYLSGSYSTGYSDARTKGTYNPVVQPIGYLPSTGETVYGSSFVYTPEKYPFNDQLKDNASKNISLGISIPIFNNWQTQTQISNAKINLLNAQLTMENTQQQIYKDIQQSYTDAVAAYNKFQSASKSLEAQKKSFDYMQKKFNVGVINVFDFNTAKNNLFKAKSELLQAKYEYIFKLKILDFYRGQPLTF